MVALTKATTTVVLLMALTICILHIVNILNNIVNIVNFLHITKYMQNSESLKVISVFRNPDTTSLLVQQYSPTPRIYN